MLRSNEWSGRWVRDQARAGMNAPAETTGRRSWPRNYATLSPRARTSTTSNGAPMSTAASTMVQKIGGLGRRALIDTSVLASLKKSEIRRISPAATASTLTVAELVRGLHTASDDLERGRRLHQLRQVENSLEVLPFDTDCAQAYGRAAAAVERIGRKPRGSRALDLMIATTALAHDLPLSKDLRGLEGLVEIVDVELPSGA